MLLLVLIQVHTHFKIEQDYEHEPEHDLKKVDPKGGKSVKISMWNFSETVVSKITGSEHEPF